MAFSWPSDTTLLVGAMSVILGGFTVPLSYLPLTQRCPRLVYVDRIGLLERVVFVVRRSKKDMEGWDRKVGSYDDSTLASSFLAC